MLFVERGLRLEVGDIDAAVEIGVAEHVLFPQPRILERGLLHPDRDGCIALLAEGRLVFAGAAGELRRSEHPEARAFAATLDL